MLQPVRGTRDLLPDLNRRFRLVYETFRAYAGRYGFEEIDTPIFEFAGIFRHMGETSDVVTKETYTFMDRGEQEITLRPEGTAGVMRAIVSNGLTQSMPQKLCYYGPMFRYERPQKGRYRQFYQFGVELLGVEQALADVEVISLAYQALTALQLEGGFTLEINTLGDTQSRNNYRKALVDYLNDYRANLSEDSLKRLDLNPLRVLDSKDEGDKKIVENAPIYRDYLNAESEDMFAQVLKGLDAVGIPYNLNYRIVRGLDYYCHATYEFVSQSLGAQGTILAGGRYDGLVKQMGGPAIPGTGWACGVDRLAMLSQLPDQISRPITLIPLGEEAEERAVRMAFDLRAKNFSIDLGYSGSLPKRLKRADKQHASHAIIFGEDELKADKVIVRTLDKGEQTEVSLSNLEAYLFNL